MIYNKKSNILFAFCGLFLVGCTQASKVSVDEAKPEVKNEESITQKNAPDSSNASSSSTSQKSLQTISKLSRIPLTQLEELISVEDANNVKLAIPMSIEQKFEISEFSADQLNLYKITYLNKIDGSCFTLFSELLGGPPNEYTEYQEVFSPALGKVELNYTEFDEFMQKPRIAIGQDGSFPIMVSEGEYALFFLSPAPNQDCNSITMAEAKKLLNLSNLFALNNFSKKPIKLMSKKSSLY